MTNHTYTVSRSILEDALRVADLDEDAIRDDYSGRFMYGDTCLGIVCDNDSQFALICAALGATADDWDFVGRVRSDSMGLGVIYYFPGVGISEDD